MGVGRVLARGELDDKLEGPKYAARRAELRREAGGPWVGATSNPARTPSQGFERWVPRIHPSVGPWYSSTFIRTDICAAAAPSPIGRQCAALSLCRARLVLRCDPPCPTRVMCDQCLQTEGEVSLAHARALVAHSSVSFVCMYWLTPGRSLLLVSSILILKKVFHYCEFSEDLT